MPAPLIGAAAMAAARIIAGQVGKKAIKKTSVKVARAIAKEAAGPKAKAPFGTYRKPSPNRKPRLRDTDNTPRKTTVRQIVGPKTKSGKMIEKKYPKTNTGKPISKQVKTSTKVDLPKGIPTRQQVEANRRGVMYKGKLVRLSPGQIKNLKTTTTKGDTIESRLARGAEQLPITSRNQAGTDRMPIAELKRYAQLLRESNVKSPNVSSAQISGGRARALTPTAERKAAAIRAAQQRAVTKAKARGMTDAQIKEMIARARREAATIAKKAK
jgi:hypothetical protein